MAKSNFIVRGGADFSAIPKELQKLQGQFKGFSKGINAGLKIAAASTIVKGLVNFSKDALQVASDLQEVQNVVDVTFGSMSKEVDNFASNALKQFGLSELSAKKFTSTMGAMLKSSGLSASAAKDMSIEVAKLTADMASFYNLDAEEAFTKIQAGLSGETEPLKRLGINMNVANMEAYAMAQGINKAWKEMSQAEQTMLRYNYLLSVTGDAQGDFARNSGSWANQIKLLKEQWQEFMSLVGKALMEILLPIVKALNELLRILISVTKEIGKIYTLITGKEVAVESNNNIADTAFDAAEGEEALADGIGEAAKAAKKALASFDELNVLQNNLTGGGSGGLAGAVNVGGLNTVMTTNQVDDGLKVKLDTEETEKYFIWFENRWRGLRQTVEIPIRVPAPIIEPIQSPVWEPNWNLDTSLQEELARVKTGFANWVPGFELQFDSFAFSIGEKTGEMSKNIQTKFNEWQIVTQGQLATWGINFQTQYALIAENIRINTETLKEAIKTNFNEWILTTSANLQGWKSGITTAVHDTVTNTLTNINSFITSSAANIESWATQTHSNVVAWGNGLIKTSYNSAVKFVENIVGGLREAWNKFKEYAQATGEKVSGSFSGGFAVSPAAFIGTTLSLIKGISGLHKGTFAPALATGGITNGPMLAMIGDNPGGREVVSPLDGLLEMIVDAMSITNNNGSNINLTVKIGEDTIGERAISYINDKTIITGESPISI